jgi:hypothetical protein
VKLKDKQISLARDGVESIIAHCIANNLEFDPRFPVQWYIDQCEIILKKNNIPEYLAVEILDEAEERGINEKAPKTDGAAQIHPFENDRLLQAIKQLSIYVGGN